MTSDIDTQPKVENTVKTRIKSHLKPPPKYKVIYLNDDKTTIEFVIDSLIEIFYYQEDRAAEKTKEIHENGSSVVAVYSYELAEQKGIEVTLAARSAGFPLQVRIEADE